VRSKVINITLPEDLLDEIDQAAQEERRTRSEYLREAARLYMATKPVREARTRTWLKEVSDVVTDPRKGTGAQRRQGSADTAVDESIIQALREARESGLL
jgi:metal-responsive CopG/Arc/MetJ family transcriptional regulator